MNIILLTNTFTPHVGGVAHSVQAFAQEYRKMGHRVLVVAPEFPNSPPDERGVMRIPAIQNFNASDFSVVLPVPKGLNEVCRDFEPDIVHSQHPFLLGMTAVRLARSHDLPLVFTHHTLYEQYTHYVPGKASVLQRFIIELATRYANLSDYVIAPSESIQQLLLERGVKKPVEVIPTGVYVENFANGDGDAFRQKHDIPADAFVVGHMGRLAPEKNLEFLARSVREVLSKRSDAYFLMVGSGPSTSRVVSLFDGAGLRDRLKLPGTLEHQALADAMNAMDVFAFASKSETQGMVLTEAMAAGLPVIALDAPGAREVVKSDFNGTLIHEEEEAVFADAIERVVDMSPQERNHFIEGARRTAEEFSMARSAEKALNCYERLEADMEARRIEDEWSWEHLMARIKVEWEIMKNITAAGDEALSAVGKDD